MTREQRAVVGRAIAAAEDGTSGRIAVRVIPDARVEAFERARHEFARAGLHRHDRHNAAMVLVAPRARKFAVIGDRALHERVGDDFWRDVVDEVRPYFARDDMTDGIVHAVGRIGAVLHAHFPELDQQERA